MKYVYLVMNVGGNSVHRVYTDGRKMQRYVDEWAARGIVRSWFRMEVTR